MRLRGCDRHLRSLSPAGCPRQRLTLTAIVPLYNTCAQQTRQQLGPSACPSPGRCHAPSPLDRNTGIVSHTMRVQRCGWRRCHWLLFAAACFTLNSNVLPPRCRSPTTRLNAPAGLQPCLRLGAAPPALRWRQRPAALQPQRQAAAAQRGSRCQRRAAPVAASAAAGAGALVRRAPVIPAEGHVPTCVAHCWPCRACRSRSRRSRRKWWLSRTHFGSSCGRTPSAAPSWAAAR